MIAHHDLNSLVHNLLNLYHKLGLSLYEIRKDLFHKTPHQHSSNIHITISKHIKQLTKVSKESSDKIQVSTDSEFQTQKKESIESKSVGTVSEKKHTDFVSTGIHTHVNRYKFKKASSKCNPAVKEQLAKNTWAHIHSAIRYARQGKKTEAKLYGELANNALKEAAHYMTEDEYFKFTSAIDLELNRIKT